MRTIALLLISNIFMTFAWYGHLKYRSSPLWIMIVVKANAYGHGLEAVAPSAAAYGDWLGVNALDEALAIRALGIQKPVAILGHTEIDQLDTVVANGFRQVVYRTDVAAGLSKA